MIVIELLLYLKSNYDIVVEKIMKWKPLLFFKCLHYHSNIFITDKSVNNSDIVLSKEIIVILICDNIIHKNRNIQENKIAMI